MIPMVRKNQFNPILGGFLNDEFVNRLFDTPDVKSTIPSVNISETKSHFSIELAAPGYVKDDVRVKIEDDLLTISSEKKVESELNEATCLRREFSFSNFKRSFTLPDNIDREKIDARMENGILTVILPKKDEKKESEKEIYIR